QDPARLQMEADKIGYPVLIKAVAGGGGKGMRRVDAAEDFADSLQSCKREAASSFGDDRVLIEKYILRPRHIEVQVFGDTHGNIVHLFERDCSLQRRHQKVIEEAPAPGMDEATRAAICDAAVKAAKAVDYVGAGTIEFIADASEGLRADRIWFMEMNTRLQVEHPVTEEITGQDLVEWQLRVASGEKLPKRQDELAISGHAIEARLYAENPSNEFLPSSGRLVLFELPEGTGRIDSAVEEGDSVTPFYDPMIAKLIVWEEKREDAIFSLSFMIEDAEIWPLKTNAPFLYRALVHNAFAAGDVDTGFIPRHLDDLVPPVETPDEVWQTAAYQLVSEGGGTLNRGLSGFRLNAQRETVMRLSDGNETRAVVMRPGRRAWRYRLAGDGEIVVRFAGQTYLIGPPRFGAAGAGGVSDGSIVSPMPGKLIAVEVRQGDKVAKGQKLVTLEAMKMEHSLVAPYDGIVAELNASEGAQVSEGALLARIEKGEGA
ncbi:MAG TPA: biotin/lipoyl-containing protein, partial [Allosphingosinicella sp.]|nr:biotin/lipoyl-containing protein [Allosphingosinicella sp.]